MPTEDFIEFQGQTLNETYATLIESGLNEPEAAQFVAGLILETVGRTRRTFSYGTPFPAEDPACATTFERSFEHEDWIDGESVVQAETTASELGFNARFHRIENDLEALGRDVARAFACVAEMRESLRHVLDELRTEINRINSDLHECCNEGPRPMPLPTPYPYPWPAPMPNDPDDLGINPLPADPGPFVYYPPGGMYGNYMLGRIPIAVNPGTTRPLGTTIIDDIEYTLHMDRGEIVALPPDVTLDTEDDITNEVVAASGMRGFVEREEVKESFGENGLTAAEVRERFGDRQLTGGVTVTDALRGIESRTRFSSPMEMVTAVENQRLESLEAGGSTGEARGRLGLTTEGDASEARVENFGALTRNERFALRRGGSGTIGEIAGMTTDEVVTTALRGGVLLSREEAGRIVGLAEMASRLGSRR